MKIEVLGDRLDLADEIEDESIALVKEAMGEASEMLRADIVDRLDNRRGPQPSPPGEPPAMQTGALARSYRALPTRVRGRVVSGGIRSRDPGANRVEFGAVDSRGIRTLPRPHVRPAFAAMQGPISEFLAEKLGATVS